MSVMYLHARTFCTFADTISIPIVAMYFQSLDSLLDAPAFFIMHVYDDIYIILIDTCLKVNTK